MIKERWKDLPDMDVGLLLKRLSNFLMCKTNDINNDFESSEEKKLRMLDLEM